MNNIKESYNAIVESRKLVLTYISIVVATAIAFVYTRIIPDVNDFLEYIPDKSSVDPSVLVSVYNKHVAAWLNWEPRKVVTTAAFLLVLTFCNAVAV